MTTLHEILSDVEAICSLEPEELAGLALELINSTGANTPSRLHPTSFTSPETLGAFDPHIRERVALVMAEGWHWLVQEGLIAPRPGDTFGWHFITRRGQKISNRTDLTSYVNAVILPKKLLHPSIAKSCWSAFMRGEYDTSVFQAFKELEIKIRDASGAKPEEIGVTLARNAFNPKNGSLTDPDPVVPDAEREALAALIAGAIGSYKNPSSHRKVLVGAVEAVEMIVLASHLYKIVESRQSLRIAAPK
jgi:uncharacterized protein (TIGR02391 family)